MSNKTVLKSAISAASLLCVMIMAGCTGTSTYGTGVSQEEQLFKDVTAMVSLGTNRKKTPINYAPRPGLINAPASASLPAPLDTSAGDESGYFPQDQEAVRKRLLRESKSRNPVVRRNALAELKRRYKPESGATNYYEAGESRTEKLRSTSRNFQADGNDHNPELSRRQRDLYLKQKAEVAGARGAAPRKYLTEPPREYRTPAETAEVGIVGEKEKTEAEKNRKPLIDFSRERGIFGKKKS